MKCTSQEVDVLTPRPGTVAGCDGECVVNVVKESYVSGECRRRKILQRTY